MVVKLLSTTLLRGGSAKTHWEKENLLGTLLRRFSIWRFSAKTDANAPNVVSEGLFAGLTKLVSGVWSKRLSGRSSGAKERPVSVKSYR